MENNSVTLSMTFSPVSPDNYAEAFSLQTQCHAFPWSESTFTDCLTDPYFAFQLEVCESVVGYYVGLNVAGEATLMDIGISAASRRKGLGNALMSDFIDQCRQRSCEEIWLEVRSSNDAAIKLYEKYGFAQIEVRKNYYQTNDGREDALIMKKGLLDQQGRLIE